MAEQKRISFFTSQVSAKGAACASLLQIAGVGLAKVSATAGSRCHLEPLLRAKKVNSIQLQANQSRHLRLPPEKGEGPARENAGPPPEDLI